VYLKIDTQGYEEQVLRGAGVTDFSQYADVPDAELLPDFFV